jgi:hypothetical protein
MDILLVKFYISLNLKLQKKAFKEFYAITQVIILLMFCRFLDESLRWLVANGKHKEIENQIRKAAKLNNTDYNTVVENIQVSKEINVIHNKNMDEEEDSRVVLTVDNEGKAEVQKYTVFTVLKHRRILMVSVVLWIAWYGF